MSRRVSVAVAGVARFLPTGDPDPAFSEDGTTIVDLASVSERVTGLSVDGRGIITILAEAYNGALGIARLRSNGRPDFSFGEAGEVVPTATARGPASGSAAGPCSRLAP